MTRITEALRRAGCAVLLALAVATCTDDPTGPSRLRAFLSVAPNIPASASNLAAFGLSVDSIRVVIVRAPNDTLADAKVAFPASQDSIALSLPLLLESPTEIVNVTVELRGGGFVLFSGTTTVEVHAGPPSATPVPTVNLTYSGPGSTVTSLVLSPLDSVVRLGDSLRFRVDAFAGTTPVSLFYVAWSTNNETLAPINAHGVLRAPNTRGAVSVTARTPTAVQSSTPITFVPVPTAVQAVAPLPPLPQVNPGAVVGPLRVKVIALDGLGVKGVPVQFAATSGGGSVANAIVVSDDSGFAQTGATVGGAAGASVFSASVAGVATPVTFNFTVLSFGATQLAFVSPPVGGFAGIALPSVVVALQDGQGVQTPTVTNPVTVSLGANPGGATLSGTLTRTPAEGIVLFDDLVIDNPGTGYTLVASASGLTSATSPSFEIIAGISGRQWTNPAGGNWSDPANWSGGIVPGPTDTVYVTLDGTYTVNFDVSASVAYLFVGGGSGTLTLVANNRTLGFDSLAVFNDNTALILTNATLNLSSAGALVTTGDIAVTPGTTHINGGLFLNSSSVLSLNGNNGNATLVVDGDLLSVGTIELGGTSWGGQVSVTTGALINSVGGLLHVVSGVSNSITGSLDNQGTIQADGSWTLNGAGANHSNLGTIDLTGGDWTLNQTGTAPSFFTAGTVTVGSGRTWTVNGGSVEYANPAPGGIGGRGTINFNSVNLDLSPELTADTLTLTFNASTVNGPGQLTVAGGALLRLTTTTVNAPLVNDGTIQANPGSNHFNGGFSNEAGAMLRLLGNNGNAGLTVPGGFSNQGTIELTGTSWGGQITLPSGTLSNAPGAQLHILNGTSNTIGGALDNSGSVLIEGPWTLNGSGADHLNSGTIAVSGANWALDQTGSTPSFTTSGIITIAAGRTWTVNGGALSYQSGAVAGKGLLALNGATLGLGLSFTHDTLGLSLNASTVNGPGTLTVAGATTLSVTNSIINAPLANAGTIQSNPGSNAFNGPFTNQTNAVLRLLGNNGTASVTVANGFTNLGTIEQTGTSWGGQLTVTAGTFTNASSATLRVLQGAGSSVTGTLDNQGTIQIDGPWTLNGSGADHLNAGTIAVSGADWVLNQTGSTPSFATTGSVTIATGRTWTVNGGALSYQSGAIGGKGVVSLLGVTLGLGQSFTHDTLALALNSTTINGPGTLTVAGGATLSITNSVVNAALVNQGAIQATPGSNSFNGGFSNEPGTLLRLLGNNGTAAVNVATGFTNQGTIELTGTSWGGALTVSGGTFTNASTGLVHVIAGTGSSLSGVLDNQGSIQIDGPWTVSGSGAAHLNSGTIAVSGANWTLNQTGTTPSFTTTGVVTIAGGRTWSVNGGALAYQSGSLGGTGNMALTAVTLGLGIGLAHDTLKLSMSSTTVNGPGTLTIAGLVPFQLTNSTFNTTLVNQATIQANPGSNAVNGSFVNQTGALLRLLGNNGSAAVTFATAFSNQGTIELAGTSWGGVLTVASGTLVNGPGALIRVVGGAGSSLTGTLDNQGAIQVDGPWTLGGAGAQHFNSGTIALGGGDWSVTQSGASPSFANSGTITVGAARTLTIANGSFFNGSTGTLAGSGTLNVSTTAFTQIGGVSPGGGGSPGALAIVGTLPSASTAVLNVEIGGTAAGQYDRVTVTGAATIDGTLNVTLVNGFTPTIGDAFTVVVAGSRTGTFANINLPTVLGAVWLPTFTTTDVQLTLVSASALLPVLWINPAGGAWSVGTNWSTGVPPGPNDSAVINLVAPSFTVTLDVNATVGFLTLGGGIGGPTWTLASGANTLTLNGGGLIAQAGILNLSGGTFGGGGTVSLLGTLNWSGGTITGAGALDVAAGSTLNISGAAAKSLNAKTIHNAGTTVWSGGPINSGLGAGFVNQAGATFDVQADVTWLYNLGGTQPRITNLTGATLTRSAGTGALRLEVPLDNSGIVSVRTGSLDLRAGGTSSGDFTISAGATLDFGQGAPVLTNGADILGSGTTRLSGGVLSVEAVDTAQVPKLYLMGGTLQGAGVVEITDSLVWSAGTMTSAGTPGITRIAPSADLLVLAAVTFTNRTIANAGTVVWTSGNWGTGSGAQLVNDAGGVIDLRANASWLHNQGGAISRIVNPVGGQLLRTIGTGVLSFNGALNNDGVVTVQAGTLSLGGGGTSAGTFSVATGSVLAVSGGNATFGPASTVTGAGGVTFSAGNATVNGLYDITGLTSVAGGVASFSGVDTSRVTSLAMTSGTLGGTGVVLLRSGGTWSGGTMTDVGVLRIPVGVTLSISGSVSLAAHTIDNAGQILWTAGSISSGSGAVLSNSGLFDVRANASWAYNLGGALPAVNNAAGATLRRSIGTGVVTFNVPIVNAGLLDVQTGTLTLNSGAPTTGTQTVATGATLQYAQGTHSWATNAAFTGAGRVLVQGNAVVNVNAVSPDTVDANWVELASGTMGGLGVLRMSDSLVWTGGTLTDAGVLRIPVGARLTIRGSTRVFNARSITVAGVVAWTGAATINSGNNAGLLIESGGLFQLESDASWNYNQGGVLPHIDNLGGGTIKRGTATSAIVVDAVLNNDGELDIQTGSVTFTNGGNAKGAATISSGATLGFGGGTHTWTGSSSITGAGTVAVSAGVVNMGGLYNVPGVTKLTGGTTSFSAADTARVTTLDLSGAGVLSGTSPVLLLGTGTWTAGTITGTGTLVIPATRTLVMTGTATKSLAGRPIVNSGTLSWTGGSISGSGSVVSIRSGATLGVEVDATWFTGSTINIDAGGVLKRSVGTGTALIGSTVNNNGTIDATSGTLRLDGGGTGSGTYVGGATLEFGAGTHTLTAGAKINSAGTVSVAGASVSIGGSGSSFAVAGVTQLLSGTLTINTPTDAQFETLQLRGGTLTGSANMVVLGSGSWTGGSLAAPTNAVYLRVPANVTLTISGTSPRTLSARTLLNFGTVNWVGGNVTSASNAVFDNQPSSLFQVSAVASWSGSGAIQIGDRANMNVTTAGTTTLGAPLIFNNQGTLDIAAGAALKVSADFNQLAGSTLQGNGILDLQSSTKIVNQGTTRPGSSPGILTIVGNWSQGTGTTLVIDVAGIVPGTEYDQFIVTGQLTMGGSLVLFGAPPPPVGVLTVVTCGACTGQPFQVTTAGGLGPPRTVAYKTQSVEVNW